MLIETSRLIISNITSNDSESLYQLHSNVEAQGFTGKPPITSFEDVTEAVRKMLDDTNKSYSERGYGRWKIVDKENDEMIGWNGLVYRESVGEIDIGYRFLPEYWGRGIATESSEAILDYGLNTLGIDKIIAITMKENTGSIRVLEKIGMQFDHFAEFQGYKDAMWFSIKNKS